MREKLRNILVGVFVLVACILIVSVIMFLSPEVGDGKKTLYLRFADINKIGTGTRLLLSGRPVGEVVSVEEIINAREQPTDEQGRIYFYQLTIKYDSSVDIYETDKIAIQTSGLLGEKAINITPVVPPAGVTPILITNQPIYADAVDPIEQTLARVRKLSNSFCETLNHIDCWFVSNQTKLTMAVDHFQSAMGGVTEAMNTINRENVIQDFKVAAETFTRNMILIDDVIEQLKHDHFFVNAGRMMKSLKSATHCFDLITQDISDGRGTLGKLIKDDDLYLNFNAIMSKANTMMNDINHYGVLFHLNKEWQRLRTQKIYFLNSLDTPDSFRNYFQSEVDEINTAMNRLSMVIDKAEETTEREKILTSPPFKRDFNELLREVDEMAAKLRMYNEKLLDMQESFCMEP